jgi:hypothetical protein
MSVGVESSVWFVDGGRDNFQATEFADWTWEQGDADHYCVPPRVVWTAHPA